MGETSEAFESEKDERVVLVPREKRERPKLDLIVEDTATIKPFPEVDAEFSVIKRSARWFLCNEETAQIRTAWMEKFEQSEQMELLEHRKAAKLIQKLGQMLYV